MTKNKDAIEGQEYLNHHRISERRKFAMADVSGRGGEVFVEVNWNEHVKKNGFIRFTIDGKSAVISREHLYGMLFILGSAAEQEKMVAPFMKKTKVQKYTKMVGITTGKALGKGEMVNVLLEFTLNPETNVVTIGKGSMSGLKKGLVAAK